MRRMFIDREGGGKVLVFGCSLGSVLGFGGVGFEHGNHRGGSGIARGSPAK